MKYLISDNAYNVLKWVGLVALPALAVLYATIGPAWGMPYVDQVVLTLNAIGVCIGALIGVSQATSKTEE